MNEMQATQTVDTVDRFFVVLLQVAFYWVHGNGDAATATAAAIYNHTAPVIAGRILTLFINNNTTTTQKMRWCAPLHAKGHVNKS